MRWIHVSRNRVGGVVLRTAALCLAVLLVGCGGEDEAKPVAKGDAPRAEVPDTGGSPANPDPATSPATPPPGTTPKTAEGTTDEPTTAAVGKQTVRWYEQVQRGSKVGYQKVVWAPSTWKGKPTVRDTTTFVSRTVRDMAGQRTVFESTTTYELERADNGDLWWLKVTVEESGRSITEETTWTGDGYENVARIRGQPERRKTVKTASPVKIDAESFLGDLARAGKLEVGQTYDLPQINMRAERVDTMKIEVLASEKIEDENGAQIDTLKIRERNPISKTEMHMWLDARGAFVRIKTEGGTLIRRVTAAQAKEQPKRPSIMRITTPSAPSLERVFSADKHIVEVHLQGDPDRKPPEFPDSPWSRVLEKEGSDAKGWKFLLELRKYDSEEKTATRPVKDPAFADDLEPTLLMQTQDPTVVATAKRVVGLETDARKAAYKLARFVTETLSKRSPDVGQASALQILRDRCGDCSEHCLLFVTLCRAAGIPARRCSGYVNIGSVWGAHAWCEIWTGQWIAADPTTGEVGAGARYLFFGYSDKPDSYPGVISSRIQNRIRFVSRSISEGEATYDLTDRQSLRRYDPKGGRYLHVLAGLEARDVPSTWRVQLSGSNRMTIQAGTMNVSITASADQGMTYESVARRSRGGLNKETFAGAPAIVFRSSSVTRYSVWSRRRRLSVSIRGGTEDDHAMLEKVLAPTFAPSPPAWK